MVAQLQVLVGDPLAAGEELEDELLVVEVEVAIDVFEPGLAGCSRSLQRLHTGAPLRLIIDERLAHVAIRRQCVVQGDGVLHGELCSRSDRKMSGVRRIT